MNHRMNEIKIPHSDLRYDDKIQNEIREKHGFFSFFPRNSFMACSFSNQQTKQKQFHKVHLEFRFHSLNLKKFLLSVNHH